MTSCSMEFFRKVKAMCATEFMTYATCLERGSSNMEFSHCRNTQVIIIHERKFWRTLKYLVFKSLLGGLGDFFGLVERVTLTS